MVLDVGGKVAAVGFDQDVGSPGAAALDVIREPPTQDQRCTLVHRLHRHRDRVRLGQLRVHHNRGRVKCGEIREHVSLERNPGVKASLILRRRNPLQCRHERQEVILHPHRALFGRIGAKQDGLLRSCHHVIIAPKTHTDFAFRRSNPFDRSQL